MVACSVRLFFPLASWSWFLLGPRGPRRWITVSLAGRLASVGKAQLPSERKPGVPRGIQDMINASLADSLPQRGVVVLVKESQLIDISLNPAQGSQEPAFIKGCIDPGTWHFLVRTSPEPPGGWKRRQPSGPRSISGGPYSSQGGGTATFRDPPMPFSWKMHLREVS